MEFPVTAFEPYNEYLYMSESETCDVTHDEDTDKEKTREFSSWNSPAAELILSTNLRQEIQGLTFSAQNASLSGDNTEQNGKMDMLMKQCFALHNKISSNSLSKGQKTYIQTEINRIKRSITGLDIAL